MEREPAWLRVGELVEKELSLFEVQAMLEQAQTASAQVRRGSASPQPDRLLPNACVRSVLAQGQSERAVKLEKELEQMRLHFKQFQATADARVRVPCHGLEPGLVFVLYAPRSRGRMCDAVRVGGWVGGWVCRRLASRQAWRRPRPRTGSWTRNSNVAWPSWGAAPQPETG